MWTIMTVIIQGVELLFWFLTLQRDNAAQRVSRWWRVRCRLYLPVALQCGALHAVEVGRDGGDAAHVRRLASSLVSCTASAALTDGSELGEVHGEEDPRDGWAGCAYGAHPRTALLATSRVGQSLHADPVFIRNYTDLFLTIDPSMCVVCAVSRILNALFSKLSVLWLLLLGGKHDRHEGTRGGGGRQARPCAGVAAQSWGWTLRGRRGGVSRGVVGRDGGPAAATLVAWFSDPRGRGRKRADGVCVRAGK
jgi:hypothetical protein